MKEKVTAGCFHTNTSLLHRCTMASAKVVNVTLPSLPSGWSAEKDFKPVGALSAPVKRNIEPVGPHFLAHARRVSSCFKALHKISIKTELIPE